MALRPGRTTRKIKRPWTRVSKKKPRKSYVTGAPHPKIHVFNMGNKQKDFDTSMWLVAESSVQIRDNALEACRVAANKYLERSIGVENFFMKILVYPHQILREHALATGAGADRFSMGMRKSFGRPKGRAAIVKENQNIVLLRLDKKNVDTGKKALKTANSKLPTPTKVIIE